MGPNSQQLKDMKKGDKAWSLLLDFVFRFRNHATVYNEIPSGDNNGENREFTLAKTPLGSVSLFLYPVTFLLPTDYTIQGNLITLGPNVTPPVDEERLLASYQYKVK